MIRDSNQWNGSVPQNAGDFNVTFDALWVVVCLVINLYRKQRPEILLVTRNEINRFLIDVPEGGELILSSRVRLYDRIKMNLREEIIIEPHLGDEGMEAFAFGIGHHTTLSAVLENWFAFTSQLNDNSNRNHYKNQNHERDKQFPHAAIIAKATVFVWIGIKPPGGGARPQRADGRGLGVGEAAPPRHVPARTCALTRPLAFEARLQQPSGRVRGRNKSDLLGQSRVLRRPCRTSPCSCSRRLLTSLWEAAKISS